MIKAAPIVIFFIGLYSNIVVAHPLYPTNIIPSLKDSDYDGVIDARDVCVNTQPGREIDNNGCAVTHLESFPFDFEIQFDHGKHQLKPEFHSKLKDSALFLQKHPDTTIVIEGHTDNIGPKKFNTALSKARAESIAHKLISTFNIPPKRIKSFGLGDEAPIVSNKTEAGRRANRRVSGEIIRTQFLKEFDHSPISIFFQKNHYKIPTNHQSIIEKLGVFLENNANGIVIIEGYTDNTGNDNINILLSRKRAENIAKTLHSRFSIDKNKIKVAGHGSSSPVASNDTEEGRQKNRRVQITTATRFNIPQEIFLPKWTIWNVGEIGENVDTKTVEY